MSNMELLPEAKDTEKHGVNRIKGLLKVKDIKMLTRSSWFIRIMRINNVVYKHKMV